MKQNGHKNIVVIGGGTGTFTLLSALKNYPANLSAVVSMADDGGSTGILRDQYGVLPPGDVRRALVALSPNPILRELFNYRFLVGDLKGHTLGNLFLSGLEKLTGSFGDAVEEASRILSINGSVIPVTLDNVRLCARLKNGTLIRGETNIDMPCIGSRAPISKIWLEPKAKINPSARDAILSADLIVIGPGDLYTSIIPNLLVVGIPEAIRASLAKKIYVCNLMTKHGETDNFRGEDFLENVEQFLSEDVFNYVLFNSKKPTKTILLKYSKENAFFVEPPDIKKKGYIFENFLERGLLIRHSEQKLAKTIMQII